MTRRIARRPGRIPARGAPGAWRIGLPAYAASEIEIRSEDLDLGDMDSADVRTALVAWDGQVLVVDPTDAAAVARGLSEISNACDEEVRSADVFERRALRNAAAGLATASWHLARRADRWAQRRR